MERCNHNGGRGIGAGHVCRCIRRPGHSERHGCECGAMWTDTAQMAREAYEKLSALPPNSQPSWFRLHYGDGFGLRSKEEA